MVLTVRYNKRRLACRDGSRRQRPRAASWAAEERKPRLRAGSVSSDSGVLRRVEDGRLRAKARRVGERSRSRERPRERSREWARVAQREEEAAAHELEVDTIVELVASFVGNGEAVRETEADPVKAALRTALRCEPRCSLRWGEEGGAPESEPWFAKAVLKQSVLNQLVLNLARRAEAGEAEDHAGAERAWAGPELALLAKLVHTFPSHGPGVARAILVGLSEHVVMRPDAARRGGRRRRGAERCESACLSAFLQVALELFQAVACTAPSAVLFDVFLALFNRVRRLERPGTMDAVVRPLNSCMAELVRLFPAETLARVVHRMIRSWPDRNGSAGMLYVELVDTVLHLCPSGLLAASGLLGRLFARLNGQLASLNSLFVRRTIQLLGAPHVMLHYVAPFREVRTATSAALFQVSRSHWCMAVREAAEELFDSLLDFA